MAVVTRKRLATRVRSFEPAPWWFEEAPAKRGFPVFEVAAGFAVLLCFAWWMTSAQLLVASARLEGGRVLACRYLTGTRVVERQYLVVAHEADQHACPLVRFG